MANHFWKYTKDLQEEYKDKVNFKEISSRTYLCSKIGSGFLFGKGEDMGKKMIVVGMMVLLLLGSGLFNINKALALGLLSEKEMQMVSGEGCGEACNDFIDCPSGSDVCWMGSPCGGGESFKIVQVRSYYPDCGPLEGYVCDRNVLYDCIEYLVYGDTECKFQLTLFCYGYYLGCFGA